MRLWALVAAALLCTLVLAGCSDNNDGDGDASSTSTTSSSSSSSSASASTTSHSSTTTSTSSSSSSTGPTGNRAPTGSVSASASGGRLVNFTLNGTDADGDHIAWDLDFGDGSVTNGTVLPWTVGHDYAAAGSYEILFSITDGKLQSAYNVTLNVTASGGGGATLFTFSEATALPGNPINSVVVPGAGVGLGANGCAAYTAGASGGDCVFTPLEPSLAGHAFTGTADVGDPDLEFWDSCDAAMGLFIQNFYTAGASEAGVVPAGAGCVILWDNGAAGDTPTFTFTVTG